MSDSKLWPDVTFEGAEEDPEVQLDVVPNKAVAVEVTMPSPNDLVTVELTREQLGFLIEYCRSDIDFVNKMLKGDKFPKDKLEEIKQVKLKIVNLGAKLRMTLEAM